MNGEQLEGVLKNYLVESDGLDSDTDEGTKDDYYMDFIYDGGYGLKPETEMRANVVKVSVVESQSGGEDVFPANGGEVYIILKVDTDGHEQYFKMSGWYASYVGTEWNDKTWREVSPKEKKVTVYE